MKTDPNAVYEPQPYPCLLYSTLEISILVHSEDEEKAARAEGYTNFTAIDPERDGLENLTKEALMDIACALVRAEMVTAPAEALVDAIRKMRAAAAAKAAEAEALDPEPDPISGPATAATDDAAPEENVPDFDAMDKDELIAFIHARDGQKPHPATGIEKLRDKAKTPPEADA